MALNERRRVLPNPGMPSLFQQLSVMPPMVKAIVGPAMVLMGVAAVIMVPDSGYSWVLLALGVIIGIPLGWQGAVQQSDEKLVQKELARAVEELELLRLDVEQAAADKRGVERFLMERGYTTSKARRWIALECGVVLPVSSLF